uniref:Uncharacterized protein n=1 Tax=Cyprinodon variegatus TaxID=28743 RepID=A0A3Q2E8U7_CYPVA
MPLHGVQAVLVVVLMFATTVKMDEVDFWRKDVTVKCPNDADLYKSNEKVDNKFEYNEQIQLECKDSPKPYLIFIKGRGEFKCFSIILSFTCIIKTALNWTVGSTKQNRQPKKKNFPEAQLIIVESKLNH